MGRNLHHFVGCIGMGFLEERDHNFVNPAPALRLNQFAEYSPSCFEFPFETEHSGGNRFCPRSGQPHHPDTAPARRRRDRDDGIVKIHCIRIRTLSFFVSRFWCEFHLTSRPVLNPNGRADESKGLADLVFQKPFIGKMQLYVLIGEQNEGWR